MTNATNPPSAVARAIAATRRRDGMLRGARALWLPLMVLFGVGALGVVIGYLPSAVISVLAILVLAGVTFLFWRAVTGFAPIDDRGASYRLEQQGGLGELAPLTSAGDRPASGDGALWAWHQTRLQGAATTLTKPANPPLSRQDGLRAVALILAIGVCVWQPAPAARALTFDMSPLFGDRDLVIEAWAQPPDYTGLPIVRLSRDAPNLALPEGSVIHARLDGATGAPRLRVAGNTTIMTRTRGEMWEATAPFVKGGAVVLDRLGARATWHIDMIKDKAPVLSAAEPIKTDSKGRLDVAFTASDDYGITSAALRITAIDPPASMGSKTSFETPLTLEGEADETGSRRVFVPVADHVLAGLPVTIAVVVRDGKGQATFGSENRLVMPQKEWKSPLGAALQEQRLLILRENRAYQARPPLFATLFDRQSGLPVKLDLSEPLSGAPEGVARAEQLMSATLSSLKRAGSLGDVAMMALTLARERVALARDTDSAQAVTPLLWQLALQAESAGQTPGQQRLAAAKDALEQALKNGASEQEIAKLSQELRAAVGERLQELAQQGSAGEGQGADGAGDGNVVSGSDIDKMLRGLEQSGGSGARQDALDQLDQLSELMENLQAGNGEGASAGGQGTGTSPLDDAMRDQRDLSDETAQRKTQSEGGPAQDLADRQEGLADRLSRPSTGERQAPNGPPQGGQGQVDANKQQAARAMRDAAQALRQGDLQGAREAQSRAEQALQQAASAQSAQQGEGEGDRDPLGRALPGMDDGRQTKVPDQVEKRRARDVREELRRRQADPNRDGQERDYLDRLLKDR